MLRLATTQPKFSIGEARSHVRDLFEPRPWVYWTDFLVSLVIGMACFGLLRRFPWERYSASVVAPSLVVLYVLCCLSFYRASLFTHELTHLRKGSFSAFRLVWNLLYGIPFLVPSFLYHTHVDHHARRQYGTEHDGEYLPLARGPRWRIFWYLGESFVVPLIAVARFLLFVPLSWVCPPFRRWVRRHASSMVIDPAYVRPLPTNQELRVWRVQETVCWLYVTVVATLLVTGRIPIGFLLLAYPLSVTVMLLNSLRTLGAHRYRSDGEPMTFADQLLDSVNYPANALVGELWAPVGLRFHALHHLFPSMPYHNLAEAHRRLMAKLPADSPYRETVSRGLWSTVRQLWREAGGERPAVQALPPSAGVLTPTSTRSRA